VNGSVLVSNKTAFNAIDDFCKFSGLNGATRYFVDPDSPEGVQAQENKDKMDAEAKAKNDEIERIMTEAQAKVAQAETVKAKAQEENVQLRAEVDFTKNQADAEIKFLKQQLDETKALIDTMSDDEDRKLRKYEIDQRTALELTRIEKDSKKEENKNFEGNKESTAA
jgi:hypothetical protein